MINSYNNECINKNYDNKNEMNNNAIKIVKIMKIFINIIMKIK